MNNIVERDHRGVKLMHMLRQGQLAGGVEQGLSAAEQFYALAV